MSINPGSFRPDELAASDADIADAERAGSYAAARELEQADLGGAECRAQQIIAREHSAEGKT